MIGPRKTSTREGSTFDGYPFNPHESTGSDRGRAGTGPGVAGQPPRKKPRQKPPETGRTSPHLPFPVCKVCGTALAPESDRPRRRGTYCPPSLETRRKEVGADIAVASQRLARKGGGGRSITPGHTAAATPRRKGANNGQRAAQATWEKEHAGEVHDPA